ncbi:MAG: carotenoid biosynthesis protein [Anaerolineaceae bacterium]|nr:carotenoid biosynthesis protein [Anaerolineaceae bacterium]
MNLFLKHKNQIPLRILIVVVYLALALLRPWDMFGEISGVMQTILNLAGFSFIFFHGKTRYGWKNILLFFAITSVISWSAETLSIATQYPFGNYHYSDLLGKKIGVVPLIIMPAYFAAGYLAWTMSTIFLENLGTGMEKRNLFLVPFIASFIMVMWDLCFDPISATIEKSWIWENGGAYFGVPISNFLGWFLTMLLIYQVFALYLYFFIENEHLNQNKDYWALAPVMFLGLALGYILNPFIKSKNLDIYWSMFLITIFTMIFTSVLNLILVYRNNETLSKSNQ